MSALVIDRPQVSSSGYSEIGDKTSKTESSAIETVANVPPGSGSSDTVIHSNWVESATPATVLLGNLRHPSLVLRTPLRLEVEREDDSIAVSNDELEEFGIGPYFTAAIEDFQLSLAELYFTLRDRQTSLGPAMESLWTRLQEIIEERS